MGKLVVVCGVEDDNGTCAHDLWRDKDIISCPVHGEIFDLSTERREQISGVAFLTTAHGCDAVRLEDL